MIEHTYPTLDQCRAIVSLRKSGVDYSQICDALKIPESRLDEWIQQGHEAAGWK